MRNKTASFPIILSCLALLLVSACEVTAETAAPQPEEDPPTRVNAASDRDEPGFTGEWKGLGYLKVRSQLKKCQLTLDIDEDAQRLEFNEVLYECDDGSRIGLFTHSGFDLKDLSVAGEDPLPYLTIYSNDKPVGRLRKDGRGINIDYFDKKMAWNIELARTELGSNTTTVMTHRHAKIRNGDYTNLFTSKIYKLERQ